MKSTTAVLAILSSLVMLDSCSSSPSVPANLDSPTIDNIQKTGEGGSSHDTLSIDANDQDGAYVFESYSAEGGSVRDTIYLRSKTRAKFYKIKDFKIRKKP